MKSGVLIDLEKWTSIWNEDWKHAIDNRVLKDS